MGDYTYDLDNRVFPGDAVDVVAFACEHCAAVVVRPGRYSTMMQSRPHFYIPRQQGVDTRRICWGRMYAADLPQAIAAWRFGGDQAVEAIACDRFRDGAV